MKKETLEQFMATLPYYGHCNHEYLEGIEQGAKWQAEQAPTYTPEEVEFIKRAVQEYWEHCFAEHPENQNDLNLTQQILNK